MSVGILARRRRENFWGISFSIEGETVGFLGRRRRDFFSVSFSLEGESVGFLGRRRRENFWGYFVLYRG